MANLLRHSREGGNPEKFITENLDIWTQAIKRKSSAGRGNGKNGKVELYGIKKLRELILELAVRGLLVPQDSSDEPATELLKRIAAEKAKLIKEGIIKRQKPLLPISDEAKPFELPEGWEWCYLREVGVLENGDRSKNYPNKSLLVESGVPFVNAGHLQNGRINKAEMTFITEERFELLKAGKFVGGDILFCLRGSLGKSAIVEGFDKGAIASSLVIVRLFGDLERYYFHNFFDSPFSYQLIKKYDNGTAQPNLSAADLGKFLVPIPPLAEQHRIVAKVDELMALCDQLEQQTETSLTAHQTLVETLLNTLTNAPDNAAFESTWQRIAEHFDSLFTTEQSIDHLKQTILQLAVMGKLVPQNPNDEPASELLKKIAAEKAKLVKEGKIKKQKTLPPVTDEEKPFDLPEGWIWAKLGEVGLCSTGKTPSTKEPKYYDGVIPFIGPGQITRNGELLNPDKFLSEIGIENSEEALPGDILMVCIGGSIGKVIVSNKRLAFNQQINSIRPLHTLPSFLHIAVSTDTFYSSVIAKATGSATPIINRAKWEELLIPICSESEQRRIVAKVDEIMVFCEQIKSQLKEAQITQLQLSDAITEQTLS